MTHLRKTVVAALAWFATLCLLSGSVPAQVPPGGFVVSSHYSQYEPGNGGLYIVSPSPGGASVAAVSGLGSDLTGGTTDVMGANSVLLIDAGTLVVGEVGPTNTAIDVHVVSLSGTAAVGDVTYPVGNQASPYPGGVIQCARISTDEVLLGTFGVGTVAGVPSSALWSLSLSSGTVTALPVTFPVPWVPGFEGLTGLCVDPTGSFAYVSLINGNGTCSFFAVTLAPPYPVTPIGSVAATVTGLYFESEGTIVASAWSGPTDAYRIDPATGSISSLCNGSISLGALSGLNAITGHGNAGELAAVSYSPMRLHSLSPSCVMSLVATTPSSGWGRPSGIAWERGPALWQVNSPIASIDLDGVEAAALGRPAVTNYLNGQAPLFSCFSSRPVGTAFDIGVNASPLIPSTHPSAWITAGMQASTWTWPHRARSSCSAGARCCRWPPSSVPSPFLSHRRVR